ncbi:MAG: DUF4440 domain-containing protein [Candidatus Limnocylindrales bacterium]
MAEHEGGGLPPVTEARLDDVLSELQRREPIFHRPEMGTSRADFDAMTEPDFWEVGASGRIYSREAVWATLQQRYADPDYWATDAWEATDFRCREAAPQTYLVTYTLRQGERVTRRMTIWRRAGDVWQIVYHQGTLVA